MGTTLQFYLKVVGWGLNLRISELSVVNPLGVFEVDLIIEQVYDTSIQVIKNKFPCSWCEIYGSMANVV